MRSRTFFQVFSLVIVGSLACQADSIDFAAFADLGDTPGPVLSTTFTLNGSAGTLAATYVDANSNTGLYGLDNPYSGTNVSEFFGADTNLNWEHLTVDGPTGFTVATFTMTFGTAVVDPTIYIENLDNSQEIFSGATDGSNNAISGSTLAGQISVVSGNNAFTTGTVGGDFAANIDPQEALFGGCEGNDGSNLSGACGSILLTGTYSSITWYATDANNPFPSGDGWDLQVSEDVSSAPEPGTLSMLGLAALLLAGWKFRSASRTRCSGLA